MNTILDQFEGYKVVSIKNLKSTKITKARKSKKAFSETEFNNKTKIPLESPYGLAPLVNNCIKRNSRFEDIKNGFIDDTEIINDFRKMVLKVDGKRSPLFVNESGELKTFPVKSRWNTEYPYAYVAGQRALDEVKGLRHVKHLILTVSKEKAEQMVPDWWVMGVEEYMAVMGGYLVSDFLRKYRAYKKKKNEKYNFVTWVMEFQKNSMVHFHILFYGTWVAPVDVLHSFWPYCEQNGIRFGKPIRHQDNGYVLAKYLTKYITKDLQNIEGKLEGYTEKEIKKMKIKMERIKAFLWFFKRRLYNLRHKVKNSEGVYTMGIGRNEYIKAGKWRLYEGVGSNDIGTNSDVEHYIEGVKMTGNLKKDLKLVAAMPVKYPVPKIKSEDQE